jgi:hypothetical protein
VNEKGQGNKEDNILRRGRALGIKKEVKGQLKAQRNRKAMQRK